MQNSYSVTFEGDHILVHSDGEKHYHFMDQLWGEIAAQCTENNCFNVLGIGNTTKPVEALEGYDAARLFRDLGIDHRYRIAWVELNPKAVDMIFFIETVLVNRGLPGRQFTNLLDARKWLLEE